MDMNNNPIISIETKKKEALGQLIRNRTVLSKNDKAPPVFDHDFSYFKNLYILNIQLSLI